MSASRRQFLRQATALAAAAPGFAGLSACAVDQADAGNPMAETLVPDPEGWLDLPPGFTYTRFSLTGEVMSDGLLTPGDHDGMAAFPVEGDPDRCLLVRNHELSPEQFEISAFAGGGSLAPDLIYDRDGQGRPHAGGTTTLLYNLRTRTLERSHLSLAGTERNCAGGPTPWGSWLTCEETLTRAGGSAERDHGYVFEVPASATGAVAPVALTAMGRFNHEACAVDPRTGIVYQTEDEADGLIYRFLPNKPGELSRGGRLQALVLMGAERADTRNWGEGDTIPAGEALAVRWIDLAATDNPDNDLAQRGFAAGAARFARGEGMAWAIDTAGASVYFACTSGGPARAGQIWRYEPSPHEGTPREAEAPGRLVLHYESARRADVDMCDNIVAAPWGHLILCEDGKADEYVKGLAPDGRLYPIARNAHPDKSEFAGACFAPDGETLFVNVQSPGATYAIRGPWAQIAV